MPKFVALLRGVDVGAARRVPMGALRELAVDVRVVVRSVRELANIVSENPIEVVPAEHSRLLVAFIQDPRGLAGFASLDKLLAPGERFALGKSQALASGGATDRCAPPDI
jgi:uncharacterized protein (DUF1697 family)